MSVALFAVARSWQLAVSSFLAGVFIDLDHFVDVFAEYRTKFTIREFFDICHAGKCHRIRLILHSWELIALLTVAAFVADWNPWLIGVTIGMTQHIICDQLHNRPRPWGYFLIGRWRHGFILRDIFGKNGEGSRSTAEGAS